MATPTAFPAPSVQLPWWTCDVTVIFEEKLVRDSGGTPAGFVKLSGRSGRISFEPSSGVGLDSLYIILGARADGTHAFLLSGFPNALVWNTWGGDYTTGLQQLTTGELGVDFLVGAGWRRHIIRYARWIEDDAGYDPWHIAADFDATRTNWRHALEWSVDGATVHALDVTRAEYAAAVHQTTGWPTWTTVAAGHRDARWVTQPPVGSDTPDDLTIPVPYPAGWGAASVRGYTDAYPTTSGTPGWTDDASPYDGLEIGLRNLQAIVNGHVVFADDCRDGNLEWQGPSLYYPGYSPLSLRQGADPLVTEETDGLLLTTPTCSAYFGGAGPTYTRQATIGVGVHATAQTDELATAAQGSKRALQHAHRFGVAGLELREPPFGNADGWHVWWPRWEPEGEDPTGAGAFVAPSEVDWYPYAKLRSGVTQYSTTSPPWTWQAQPLISYGQLSTIRYWGHSARHAYYENQRESVVQDTGSSPSWQALTGFTAPRTCLGHGPGSGEWFQLRFDNRGPTGSVAEQYHLWPTAGMQPYGMDYYAGSRANMRPGWDAVGCVDWVARAPIIISLYDDWADPAATRADYDLRLVRADPPDAPVIIATLPVDDTIRGYRLADCTLTDSGALWIALWRLSTDGDYDLLFYRQIHPYEEATLVATDMAARRPVRWVSQFIRDPVSAELWFAAWQQTGGSDADLALWTIPTAGEGAPTKELIPTVTSLPTPPYGAWTGPAHAVYQWWLHGLLIDASGLPRLRLCGGGWFDPSATIDTAWRAAHYDDTGSLVTEAEPEIGLPWVNLWCEYDGDRALNGGASMAPSWAQRTPAEWARR